MCMSRYYPAPGGDKIAALEPGDEVVIKAKFGHPSKEEDVTDIVLSVNGFSALTASGVKLACWDSAGIEKTGRHFEDGEYEVSPEAQAILEQAMLENAIRDLGEAGLVTRLRSEDDLLQ